MFVGAKCMAAVMDFGVGALMAVGILMYFEQEVTMYTFVIGGFLALIPDMDVVPSLMRGRSLQFDHHQSLFHRPLLVIPLATPAAYLLGGPIWGLIALLATTYHFLHDTGWFTDTTGISWLWPFSPHCWSWNRSYPVPGHVDQHEWLGQHWLRPTTKSMIEIGLGLLALMSVAFITTPPNPLPVLAAVLIVLGTAFVWFIAPRVGHD